MKTKTIFLYILLSTCLLYIYLINLLASKFNYSGAYEISEESAAKIQHKIYWTRKKLTATSFNDLIVKNSNTSINIKFNPETDVLVHLHIQKTSGSNWENYIYRELQVNVLKNWKDACNVYRKRYICMRNKRFQSFYWDRYLISKCDIHASYSELYNCVIERSRFFGPNGRAHFITFLRDPIDRYISEFTHVKRGATWSKAVRFCTEQNIYKQKCYNTTNWKNVSWNEFISCKNNLANNRQVRMLANYNNLGCDILKCMSYNVTKCTNYSLFETEQTLLESAKNTLVSLSFFGIAEYQELSQYLFEKTYENVFRFKAKFNQINQTFARSLSNSNDVMRKDAKLINHLDNQLYEFALKLFFERIQYFRNLNVSN